MENKERIDQLLTDLRELQQLLKSVQNADVIPVAFFSRTFDLAHNLLKDLHQLEGAQIESLQKQMEEYQRMILAISLTQEDPPQPEPVKQPAPKPVKQPKAAEPKQAEPVEQPKAEQPEPARKQPQTLNDALETQNLSDFRKAFSLNDRFYFRKELFGGDEGKMNKIITDLNDIHTYEASVNYLNEKLNWSTDNPTVADFLQLLEKRFR